MRAINNRILKVKDRVSETELQIALTSQKLSFEEDREMRRAINQFQSRLQDEQLTIDKLEREVA